MDNKQNPIKLFFSKDNAEYLYASIKRGLQEQYGVHIDNRYTPQLISIMKMVLEPLPKRIPADVDRGWFLKTLNRQTLKEALPLFADIAKGESGVAEPAATTGGLSTPIRSVPMNDEDAYKQMRESRGLDGTEPKRPVVPKFEDPSVDYVDDVNDLYEHAEQARQLRDVLPTPDADQPLPFEPQQGFEIRPAPTQYSAEAPLPKDVDFSVVEETAVLIPKTSRNLVHDSQMIPRMFVVDSRDRNPSTFPSPSQYRIELRQPYIDVVSVKLVNATFPLTIFNVNEHNNVIYFQETAGTTLTATLPVGAYPDASTLAASIAAVMTTASANGVTYSSGINPLTGKITLTSDGAAGSIFSLIFFGQPTLEGEGTPEFRREKAQYPDQSVGELVGYDMTNYTGALTYEAPFVPLLGGDANVYLHIDELEMIEANNAEVHNAFAQIPLQPCCGQNYTWFRPYESAFVKFFSPPRGKLAYLNVSLRNVNGDLINFNGANHTFTLSVITKDKTQSPYDEV